MAELAIYIYRYRFNGKVSNIDMHRISREKQLTRSLEDRVGLTKERTAAYYGASLPCLPRGKGGYCKIV